MAGERTERLDRRAASEVAGAVTTDSICHNENRWAYTVCVLIAVVRRTRWVDTTRVSSANVT